ncbi:hypothetical protein [Sphingomonas flavalba]|uniref:hypothetical protein n=1 Tax=Sphingomonas flavalba TaxID=2559804 RepID=UPI00109DC2C3|nr:hypothetical protein [Sphingomonas flavalba]
MRRALIIIGVVAALVGFWWLGQGTEVIRWPASSMLGEPFWVTAGSALGALGLVLILIARRIR